MNETIQSTTLKYSLIPSIKEAERFIHYLNKRFKLNLPDNLTVTIHETKPEIAGFFRNKDSQAHYYKKDKKINNITLSSINLSKEIYDTIAHELTHYYNYTNKIKDCSSNQYHNKHFKTTAEKLLLKVERGKRGYAYTSATKEFNQMLKDFKTNKTAFQILQKPKPSKQKAPNRNILYMCDCGIKIRTARSNELKAVCMKCETMFKEQE